jgi:Bacterial archaeo-eukaryotic release factor family 10
MHMLNHVELAKLEQALRLNTVLSIYVNGEVADVAARAQWRTELRNALDAITESLHGATHKEREDFTATRELALQEIDNFTPGEGAPGWMGFFTPGKVHHASIVPVPVPTLATWSVGPNLAPAIRVLKEARPVLVVVADATRASIHRYVEGAISLVESLERDAKVDQPYHMSRPPRPGFGSGTRGRPGAEAAQREQRKATDQMLAEAATKIQQLAAEDAWVLIGGIDVVAAALLGRLDKRFSDRAAVVPIDVHDNEAALAKAAREHASRLRRADDLKRVEDVVVATAKGGTGAMGLQDIDRALLNGQVHELYITSTFVNEHSDEAVSAIRRAFEEGATVEHVSGDAAERLDAAGGIAARLRFTIANSDSGAATAL